MWRIYIILLVALYGCADHSNGNRVSTALGDCWNDADLETGAVVNGTGVALYFPQNAIIIQDNCHTHRLVVDFEDRARGYEMIDNMRNASREQWHGGQPYLVRFTGVIGEFDGRRHAWTLQANRVDITRRVLQP
jgi:hypothetical protein